MRIRWAAALAALSLVCWAPTGARQASVAGPSVEPDVVYIPTPQPVVDAMLSLAEVGPTDVVYDLGSGDGRIVITAATKYGARGVGIEIDPALVEQARAAAEAAGVSDRVRFMTGDLFDADIHEATVVTLYLLQSLNERLRPKLVADLAPGTRIVSHVFDMGPEWPPTRQIMIGASPVFLWVTENRPPRAPRPVDPGLRSGL